MRKLDQRKQDMTEYIILITLIAMAAIAAIKYFGSKTKAGVPRAIADRVVAHPDEAEQLLPMLALALHSVRAPERAAALAALARALHGDPALAARARVHLPTLTVGVEVIR